MSKVQKIKSFLILGLVIIFVSMIFSPFTVAGQAAPFAEVEERLVGISEEEKEILKNLFMLLQEIEEIEREEEEITQEIELMNREIQDLEVAIADEEIAFKKKQEDLKQVLKSYQRRGSGSYLEIILDSDSLATLLRRINILRDLTRNTGELLESLEESSEKLSAEKTKRIEKLLLMEINQEKLRDSLVKKLELKEEMEAFLASLEEEKEYYQEHLANIQQVWDQLKPLLSEITQEFSRIIEAGNWPPDALKTTFSFFSIKGSIDEKALNDIITGDSGLQEMALRLYQGKFEMSLPKQHLVLSGIFIIEGEQVLTFQPNEGSFYGMPLELAAIEELFRDGYPVLNLKPLIGNNIILSIEIMEGYLELQVKPVL